ncbi:hypothetical protein [Methylobacterium isbiliense]|uniref:Uncharacterized protein n=1 Tax=Methylobacterium isbiliense TaxID=315478 RepID=A0ABQ4SAI1_9HYPH|nr:hypothetical protein [Methylobacterium isbiliense]MDN3622002.1 hypothetical protein [Methylobacterium isbiliense]GJD99484.1 hypothetical protein GMJLKIPL_1402 [Methylobacterium isbiliense]
MTRRSSQCGSCEGAASLGIVGFHGLNLPDITAEDLTRRLLALQLATCVVRKDKAQLVDIARKGDEAVQALLGSLEEFTSTAEYLEALAAMCRDAEARSLVVLAIVSNEP